MWYKDGQIFSEQQIRQQFPDTLFGTPFTPPEGYEVVFGTPSPTITIYQVAYQDGTEIDSKGNRVYKWSVRDMTTAEIVEVDKRISTDIVNATQSRLDTFAQSRGYDSILSACTYATSTIAKFQADGKYCVDSRDNTWSTIYQYQEEVSAGTKPKPTSFVDIEPLLPALEWPS